MKAIFKFLPVSALCFLGVSSAVAVDRITAAYTSIAEKKRYETIPDGISRATFSVRHTRESGYPD